MQRWKHSQQGETGERMEPHSFRETDRPTRSGTDGERGENIGKRIRGEYREQNPDREDLKRDSDRRRADSNHGDRDRDREHRAAAGIPYDNHRPTNTHALHT